MWDSSLWFFLFAEYRFQRGWFVFEIRLSRVVSFPVTPSLVFVFGSWFLLLAVAVPVSVSIQLLSVCVSAYLVAYVVCCIGLWCLL